MRTSIVLSLVLGFLCSSGRVTGQVEREIRLPVEDGRVSVLQLSRKLLDAYGYDGDSLRFRDVEVRSTLR